MGLEIGTSQDLDGLCSAEICDQRTSGVSASLSGRGRAHVAVYRLFRGLKRLQRPTSLCPTDRDDQGPQNPTVAVGKRRPGFRLLCFQNWGAIRKFGSHG
jgi:hypothetical protein